MRAGLLLLLAAGAEAVPFGGPGLTMPKALALEEGNPDYKAEIWVGNPPAGYERGYWNNIPSNPQSYTVEVGTLLKFGYDVNHDVWLMPSHAATEDCDFSGEAKLLGGERIGGGPDSPDRYNLFQAVTKTKGALYFSCSQSDHCARGQQLLVEVVDSNDPTTPPTPDKSPPSSSPPPSPPPRPASRGSS